MEKHSTGGAVNSKLRDKCFQKSNVQPHAGNRQKTSAKK